MTPLRRSDLALLALIASLLGLGAWLLASHSSHTPAALPQPASSTASLTPGTPPPSAPAPPGPVSPSLPLAASVSPSTAPPAPVATQDPQEDLGAAQQLLERSYPGTLAGAVAEQAVGQAWAALTADLLAAGTTQTSVDGAVALERPSGRWVIVMWSGVSRAGTSIIGQLSSVRLVDGAVEQIVTGPPPA